MTTLVRPGLALLAAIEILLGLWTLLFPASFYDDVPMVDVTPPFSEHLLRDFGGATLGLAVVLTAAAVWMERHLVVTALLGYLAFAAPHLVFHVSHLHGLGGPEATALVAVLTGSLVLPLTLLVVALRGPAPAAATRAREHVGRTGT